jgi:OmpA-OmpF porin, OOP family
VTSNDSPDQVSVVLTSFVDAGAGLGLVDGNGSLSSTAFAYQGIVGLAWNADTNFRATLDGRYYGTSNPQINGANWTNNNFSVMLGLLVKTADGVREPQNCRVEIVIQ